MSEEIEFVKVEKLKPYDKRVNVKGKILNIGEGREVSGGEHRVAEALFADETGCILLSLWDEDTKNFSEGDVVQVENGHVPVFGGSMRLSAGRFGTVKKIDEEISEVNTENNLSDKKVEQRQRRYGPRRYGRGFGRSYGRGFRGRRGSYKRGYKR